MSELTLVEFLTRMLDADETVAWSIHNLDCEACGPVPFPCTCDHPARVLVEVDAKRRIVAAWPDTFGEWTAEQASAASMVKERVLRLLALPFADHPDYRAEEWAP